MKKTMMAMAVAMMALLSCLTAQAQDLDELIAPGKKVFVEVVDVKETLELADEIKDCKELTADQFDWKVVDTKDEADFVLQLSMWRKKMIGFPRCYMKPAILLPDGTEVWEGKELKGDANEFNGFRATVAAYWAFVKSVKKDKAFAPAVKDNNKKK